MSFSSEPPRSGHDANASSIPWLAWSLLGLLGVIWGTNFLFMKMAVAVVPPLEVAWLRTIFGALPIAALALVRRSLARTDWRFAHHFAAMVLLANVGPYAFFVIGTAHLPSGVAGVISGAIPFVTAAIVAIALPAERLTWVKALGLGIGFAGVLLVAARTRSSLGKWWLAADRVAAMLAGSVSYALALVYARRFMVSLGLGPVKLATYQMLFAANLLAPSAAPGHWSELAAHSEALLALVFGLGLAGTGVAFLIYYQHIQILGALKTASVYYIPPVVALVVGWATAGETITLVQAISATLVMAGIFYANRDGAG